jgi:hypothetical protein
LCVTLVIYQETLHDARSTKCKIYRYVSCSVPYVATKNVYENEICCYKWETSQIVDKMCALYEVRVQYPRIRHRLDSYVSKFASSILRVVRENLLELP